MDFTIIDDVENMYIALFTALRRLLSEDMFRNLRRACFIYKMFEKFPKSFVAKICDTQNLDELFDVIVMSDHCNWMNIRLLERIAAALFCLNVPSIYHNAHHLIEQYKNAVFSKPLVHVIQQIPKVENTKNYYFQVKQIWKENFWKVTLKDIVRQWNKLEEIFDVESALFLQNVIESSIQFLWLIPTELVCHARYSAFRNWHQLDDILYLDICGYIITDSEYEFSTINANTGIYSLVKHT